MLKILIIEDEKKAARELENIIREIQPGVIIYDAIQSVSEAVEWLHENPVPDLIFSDIQLADGLCFEIFREAPVYIPVIFCTAYDEYAIRAFEANGIDYLLKPVDKPKLEQSLKRYGQLKSAFGKTPEHHEKMEALFRQLSNPYKSTFLVRYKEKYIPLKVSDIAFIYYDNGACTAHVQQQKYFLPHTMEELEKMLDPSRFFRANRQFIIQKNYIQTIEQYFARKLFVKMQVPTPENLVVSKAKASSFLHWIESGTL